MSPRSETSTLGGGCYWCLEAVYDALRGVQKVVSGFSGGTVKNPSYREVCEGTTGHAEVVQVTYDPAQVTFRDLLEIFFTIHDPTTPNRQGADVGSQYRSVIFYHDPAQKQTAEDVMREVSARGIWEGKIVTQLVPFAEFYSAEAHHQDYFAQNPDQGYCRAVIAPKVAKFRKEFFDRLKK